MNMKYPKKTGSKVSEVREAQTAYQSDFGSEYQSEDHKYTNGQQEAILNAMFSNFATKEELAKWKQEISENIHDMELRLINNQASKEDLENLRKSTESQFDKMDARVASIESRMASMDARVASKEDLNNLQSQFDNMNERMASKEDLNNLQSQFDKMDARMASMDARVASKEDLENLQKFLEGRMDSNDSLTAYSAKADLMNFKDEVRQEFKDLEERINAKIDASLKSVVETMRHETQSIISSVLNKHTKWMIGVGIALATLIVLLR